jgi:hypothetical protein
MLPEDDPLAAFASEPDDAVEQGSVPESVPPSVLTADVCTPALPTEADLFRSIPDEPMRLTLAPPQRHVSRVATRMAVAAAVMALAAAGAYLYPRKPLPLTGQIADTRSAPRELPARVEADTAVAPFTAPEISAPDGNTDSPPRRISKPREMKPTSAFVAGVDSAATASSDAADSTDADRGPVESPVLSGDWTMNTRVETSRLQRYEGLRLGYRVTLRQHGNRISGTGWKVSEDERTIGTTARTPITLDGTLTDDRLELTFTERGRLRVTGGKLVLARHSDNTMRGRFSSTAAQSFGVVEIHR